MSTSNRLAAILGGAAISATAPAVTNTLPVDGLRPGKGQPRRHFDEQALAELARSIKDQGVLQPLLVRPVEGGHEIVAGERRWRAAQMAGLRDVPVLVRAMTDEEARAAALLENIQRKDLSPIEEIEGKLVVVAAALNLSAAAAVEAMQAARTEPGELGTQLDQIFSAFGGETWQSYASNKLAVFGWSPAVLNAMRQGLEFTKAKLIQTAPEEMQDDLIGRALQGASRTELQAVVRQGAKPKRKAPSTEEQVVTALRNRKKLAKLSPEKAERVQLLLNELLKELGN